MSKTQIAVFWILFFIAILGALAIIPGLDFLVWYVLKPVGFMEKGVVMGIELITLAPRMALGFAFFGITATLASKLTD